MSKISSLTLGIVGLPNVGKSSLFNLLTGGNVAASNFPFCTISPNHGLHKVFDSNLDLLTRHSVAKKTVPADVRVVDIAGLIEGASKGLGQGNQFLSTVRTCSSLMQVVRCFDGPDIAHVMETVNVRRDVEIIDTEMCLADADTVENCLTKKKALLAFDGKKEELHTLLERLSNGESARGFMHNFDPKTILFIEKNLQLLTAKPIMFVGNVDEIQAASLSNGEKVTEVEELLAIAKEHSEKENVATMVKCVPVGVENELNDIADAEERQSMLDLYSIGDFYTRQLSSLPEERPILIPASQLGIDLLNTLRLFPYYTAGEKEVRAWIVPEGSNTRYAASRIHSDIAKGLVRTQCYNVNEIQTVGQKVPFRTLFPDDLVTRGDVYEFLHS